MMTFTNSPLVTYTNLTKNKTKNRKQAIDTITIHCIVGQWTAKQGCDFFATTDKQCSANYVVGKDGSIGLSVEEKDRSWCTSSAANDNRAVTIEVASDTSHPYAVTDKAYAALLDLVTDICKRNGIKKLVWSESKEDRKNHLNGCNMTVHRDYANKSCPGEYLYSRHGEIADIVNERLSPKEKPAEHPTTLTVNDFKVGEIVEFTGDCHYDAASSTKSHKTVPGLAKVTATYKNGVHQLHVRAINNHGNFVSGVYGWVDIANVKKLPKTEPEVGDIVNFTGNTHYISSTSKTGRKTKPSRAKVTYISNIKGNNVHKYHIRAINDKGNFISGGVYGWVDADDIKLV